MRTVLFGLVISFGLLAGPAVGADDAPTGADAAPFVAERSAMRAYSSDPDGVAVDHWAVFVCAIDPATDAGPPERLTITPDDVVAVLDAHIAPYYEWLSESAYRPEFSVGTTITPGPVDTLDDAQEACVDDAVEAGAGAEGALVVHDATEPSGFASSGHERCGDTPCTDVTLPASHRHAWLGGSTLFETAAHGAPQLSVVAHELGHTLDWGHAGWNPNYWAVFEDWYRTNVDRWVWIWEQTPPEVAAVITASLPDDFPTVAELAAGYSDGSLAWDEVSFPLAIYFGVLEYADLTDVMGVTPVVGGRAESIPRTQAFNRYAAGWIDDADTAIHGDATSTSTYRLAPIGVDGLALLVIPTTDPRAFFTLEVQRPSEFYPEDPHLGVVVHAVDQRPVICGRDVADCWGEERLTATEGADPYGFGHVLGVGVVRDVGGVRVEVVAEAPDGGFVVRVGPAAVVPPAPPAPAVVTPPAFTG